MNEYRKLLAKRCLDQMQSHSLTASRVMVVWCFVLITVWLLKIEPHFRIQILPIRESIQEKQRIELQIAEFKSEKRPKEIIAPLRVKIGKVEQQLKSERAEAKKIKFPLPGYGDVPVPALSAPVFWSLLSFGLLVYLTKARLSNFRLAARSYRIYFTELNIGDRDFAHFGEGLSWWMIPIPSQDGKGTKVLSFQEFVGRPKCNIYEILGLALFFVAIFLTELRMGYLLWSTSGAFARIGTDRLMLLSTQITILLATLLLIYRWFYSHSVPDQPDGERSPNSMTRRQFAIHSGSLIVSFLFLPTMRWAKTTTSAYSKKNPRFIASKGMATRLTGLESNNFYKNIKSGIYHYVFEGGLLRLPSAINESNFQKVSVSEFIGRNRNSRHRVDLVNATVSYEAAATNAVRARDIEAACKLLIDGIRIELSNEVLNYRLADFLASLAVRHSNDYVQQLIEIIWQNGKQDSFADRIKKWNDTNSTWHKRWSNKSKQIKWADLLM